MNNGIPVDTLRFHLNNLLLISKKLLGFLRTSKPGIAGLAIILAFAFMAVFAPFIAPYDVNFMAPPEDLFSINRIEMEYQVKDGYHPITVGPTTPSESDVGGGLWIIIANVDGTIRMDYTKKVSNTDPFEAGNLTLNIDITEHGLETPLSQVLYASPARGYINEQAMTPAFREKTLDGLLMFMSNTTFVIFDPFRETVLFTEDVGFVPTWFLQDTTSAGNMYNPPDQNKVPVGIWGSILTGPYRYVTLAKEDRIITYKFEYCWNIRRIGQVDRIIDAEMPVTQRPLAYTFDNNLYTNASGIYVPSDNGTLHYFNSTTNGTAAIVTQFNISGEPVEFTGPMGYQASADNFPHIYIPTAVGTDYSVKLYTPMDHNLMGEFSGQDGRVELRPLANTADEVYVTVNYYDNDMPVNSSVFRVDEFGKLDTTFNGRMFTLAVELFDVEQASNLFALDNRGVLYKAPTGVDEDILDIPYVERGMKEYLFTGSENSQLIYLGSFGGSKYGKMSSIEMYNAFFVPEESTFIALQSIGTSLGALPPGVYPSGNRYVLGTDNVGHDILTRLIYGTRVALLVGLTAAFFSVIVGTLIGVVSGYYGGWVDIVIMRITDIFLTIPFLPIVLIATQVVGQSIWNIVIILAFLGWSGIARVVRAQTLSLKQRSFIDAARVSGSSDSKIILKHITPNVLPFTFLYMTLFVAGAILTEAALSFLALGDPKVVSWGNMLSTIQTSGHSLIAPWWMLPPGLAITTLSMGFYLLGRGVDEIINPRLRRR